RGEHAGHERGQEVLLLVDEALTGGAGELVVVAHGQRPRGAGLDAVPAEDAALVVDLVDAAVALPGGVLGVGAVVGALDEDRVRRARPGAQLAADALLQAVRVAVELVAAVVARLRRHLLERVLLGDRGPEHRGEGDPEAGDGCEELADRALLVGLVVHGEPLADLPPALRGLGKLLAQVLLARLVVLPLSHRWPPVQVPIWSGSRCRPRRGGAAGRAGAAGPASAARGSRRRRRRTRSRRRRRQRPWAPPPRRRAPSSSPATRG